MPVFWLLISIMCTPGVLLAQADFSYKVDLRKVVKDKVLVTGSVTVQGDDTLRLAMPRVVPGTYSVSDFGQFVSGFKVYNSDSVAMEFDHPGTNLWIVPVPKETKTLFFSYQLDDSWDARTDNEIFIPAGTSIMEDEFFLVNPFGWFMYAEEDYDSGFEILFLKHDYFLASSSLKAVNATDSSVLYTSDDYNLLADEPLIIGRIDTASIMFGDSRIILAVYDDARIGKKYSADTLLGYIEPVLQAASSYLGGELPVERYAFLIYIFRKFDIFSAYGALEHNRSSVYYLPGFMELPESEFPPIAAHEFFHIITPLNIHSEQIHEFDFYDPEMSAHLWLYEGVTEYSSVKSMLYGGLISRSEFLENIQSKIESSREYDEHLPFTSLSKEVLDKYSEEFGNVYEKGALIAMCLDITLLKASELKYGLRDLMQDMGKRFGPEKSFPDDSLFQIIGEISYPEARIFLENYVGGEEKLPLSEILSLAGYYYSENPAPMLTSYGNFEWEVNEDGLPEITETDGMNEFGKATGLKEGDVLLSWDGMKFGKGKPGEIFEDFERSAGQGDLLKIQILRPKGSRKKMKKKELVVEVFQILSYPMGVITEKHNPDEKELQLREAWLESKN